MPIIIVLVTFFGLVWWGIHYKIFNSLRLRVEISHVNNRLFKSDRGFSIRHAYVQIREFGYDTFGGTGLPGHIVIVLLAIGIVFILGYIVTWAAKTGISIAYVTPFDARFFNTIWQVQATIVTLAFVVAIFLWQALLNMTPYEGVLRLFIRYSHSIFGVVYSLTSTIAIGFLLLRWYPQPNDSVQFPLYYGFTIILLSLTTYFFIFLMYRRAAGLLVYGEDKKLVFRLSRTGLYQALSPSKREIERQLRHNWFGVHRTLTVTAFTQSQVTEFSAQSLGLSGVITDINLRAMSGMIDKIESNNLSVESVPQIGRDLDAAPGATLFAVEGSMSKNIHDEIEKTLKKAIVTRKGRNVSW